MRRVLAMLTTVGLLAGVLTGTAAAQPAEAAHDPGHELIVLDFDTSIQEVAYDGDDFAYVRAGDDVIVFSLPTWRYERTITPGVLTLPMVVRDGVIVASSSDLVVEIDGVTGEVLATYDPSPLLGGSERVWDVVADDDQILGVTAAGLFRVDRNDGSIALVAAGATGDIYAELLLDETGGYAYVGNGEPGYPKKLDWTDPTLPVVGAYAGSVSWENAGSFSSAMALSSDGAELYGGGGETIDTETMTLVDTLDVGPAGGGTDERSIWYRPWAEQIQLVDRDSREITRVDSVCRLYGSVDQGELEVGGNRMVVWLASDHQLCIEPVDGSGAAPGSLRLRAGSSFAGVSPVDVYFLVWSDVSGRLVYESPAPQDTLEIQVPAGGYLVLVIDEIRPEHYPFFSAWHDGSPILSKGDLDPLVVPPSLDVPERDILLDPVFSDLWDGSPTFRGAIIWLRDTGITRGCSEIDFCGRDYVTRGQMAAFIDRALGLPTGPPTP
ncbi:MAG: hypothetical protein AAF548_20000, partial [Actinomycetota bacterium]